MTATYDKHPRGSPKPFRVRYARREWAWRVSAVLVVLWLVAWHLGVRGLVLSSLGGLGLQGAIRDGVAFVVYLLPPVLCAVLGQFTLMLKRARDRAVRVNYWLCPCCFYPLHPEPTLAPTIDAPSVDASTPEPEGELGATCPECGFVLREHERVHWWTSRLLLREPEDDYANNR